MSDIDSVEHTTESAKAAPRYRRRRSDIGKSAQKANRRFAASFDHSAAAAGIASRHDKQRAAGDKAVAAAAVALESRAVSTAAPVGWSVPEIPPDADLATADPRFRAGEADDDDNVRRVPPIVTLILVVGTSMLMWGGIVALVFAL